MVCPACTSGGNCQCSCYCPSSSSGAFQTSSSGGSGTSSSSSGSIQNSSSSSSSSSSSGLPATCKIDDERFNSEQGGCRRIDSPAVVNSVWSNVSTADTFIDASRYCDSLVEGGYDDWRLPYWELRRLIESEESILRYIDFDPNKYYWIGSNTVINPSDKTIVDPTITRVDKGIICLRYVYPSLS